MQQWHFANTFIVISTKNHCVEQLLCYGGLTFESVTIFVDIKDKKLPEMQHIFSLFTIAVKLLVLFLVSSLSHTKSQL